MGKISKKSQELSYRPLFRRYNTTSAFNHADTPLDCLNSDRFPISQTVELQQCQRYKQTVMEELTTENQRISEQKWQIKGENQSMVHENTRLLEQVD